MLRTSLSMASNKQNLAHNNYRAGRCSWSSKTIIAWSSISMTFKQKKNENRSIPLFPSHSSNGCRLKMIFWISQRSLPSSSHLHLSDGLIGPQAANKSTQKMTDTDEWYLVSTRETSPNRMSLGKSTLIFKSFGNFTWHFTMCSAFVVLSLVKHLYHTWHLLFLSCWHLLDWAAKTWRTVGDISLLPTEIWNSSRHLSLQHLVRWNEEWTYWLAGTNLFQSRFHHWFISLTEQRESIFRLLLKLNPATLDGFHPYQRFFPLKCDLKSDRSWFSN